MANAGGVAGLRTTGTAGAPSTTSRPEEEPVAAALGRMGAELERAHAELELVTAVRERLAAEVKRLQRRISEAEAERIELIEHLAHRDRLLTMIQSSRSWRYTQRLRRLLGRR